MKHTTRTRRVKAALLALLLLLSLIPTALAADVCPQCTSANCVKTVVKKANCHEAGVDKFVCAACGKTTLLETPIDPAAHDVRCTDNGDGATHTASCPYHPVYTGVKEVHTFVDGRCTGCLAVDYTDVKLSLPGEMSLYVDLGDTSAVANLGGVTITAGGVDITSEYTLRYNWYYNGEPVGTGKSYQLPASMVMIEGDYSLVCFVMAVAKNGIATENAACTVTVHVRDMISASMSLSTRDLYATMGDTSSRTPVSVAEQIYMSYYTRTGKLPEFIRFGDKPLSDVGELKIGDYLYYFTPAAGQKSLAEVRFESTRSAAGTYTIPFTVYDKEGKTCLGTLTVTVEQSLDDMSINYPVVSGGTVLLNSADFDAFWQHTYPAGKLTLVRFTSLPSATRGILYSGYVSPLRPGTAVQTGEAFYREGMGQTLLSSVAFVAEKTFTGCVVLPFEAYGANNRGVQTYLSGNVFFFVTAGKVEDVTARVAFGGSIALNPDDFLSVYRTASGTNDSNFYIQFLDTPLAGAFYLGRTGTTSGTLLTAITLPAVSLHHSSDYTNIISDLLYVPGRTGESLRYAAYDSQGNLLYIGNMNFDVFSYTKSFIDVKPSNWFYTYVMDLAEAGVINGMTATTYSPDSEVTYGQALKLIMLAAGYDEQAPTGTTWASGYLSTAQADGLISTSVTESDLNRKISRYAIAEIAAKALQLPKPSATSSPFSDMAMTSSYANWVLALYEAGIVEGTDVNGQLKFYGVNSIRRSEMATIVWRIMGYRD